MSLMSFASRAVVFIWWASAELTPIIAAASDGVSASAVRERLNVVAVHRLPSIAPSDSTPGAGLLDPALVGSDQTSADTGRMTWGHRDFHDYTSSYLCDGAITMTRRALQWSDSLPTVSQTAPSLPGVRAVADACGRPFTAMTVSPGALGSVFRIALVRNDLLEALAVIQREAAIAATPALKASRLTKFLELALTAQPSWVALADTLLHEVEAMPASVGRVGSFAGHVAFLRYWRARYVPDSVRAHAVASLALLRAMPDTEQAVSEAVVPYLALIELSSDAFDSTEVQQWMEQGEQALATWQRGGGLSELEHAAAMLRLHEQTPDKLPSGIQTPYSFYTGGTSHPAPNHVAVLFHLSPGCLSDCLVLYTAARQLYRDYGNALDLTFLTATRGSAIGTGPLPPETEAQKRASYYHDVLQLPVAVLVDETPLRKRADGHVLRGVARTGHMFNNWRGVNTVLLDRSGAVAWEGNIRAANDLHELDAVVRHMMSSH